MIDTNLNNTSDNQLNNSEVNTAEHNNDCCNKNDYAVVEFKGHRRLIFSNKNNIAINKGDKVLVQLASGIDLGTVIFTKGADCEYITKRNVSDTSNIVVRLADNNDLDKEFLNRYDEPDIIFRTNEMAQNFEINMKIVDAEWQFDKQKLTIYFTAPDRVDFRELVKELARQFKTRIELRQINSREETRRLGSGVGCCGQPICCTSCLFDFNQVTIEHARIQQLSNNVTKLSGRCGRLKCCLLYEYEYYAEELKNYPEINSTVKLDDGEGIMNKIDIFKHNVNVFNTTLKKNITFSLEEIKKYVDEGKVTPPVSSEFKLDENIDEDLILDE